MSLQANFKYTSSRPSPLLPPKLENNVRAGFKPIAKSPKSKIPRHDALASLKLSTRTFCSNWVLFKEGEAQEQGPKLAAVYRTGGDGMGTVLTRERTMALYELHSVANDIDV
ncbi:hypothetical protein HDU98_002099 [Podochytrium sp. JEL0797]|nr:hypothetical protein HDU98_002099 [Podochytrium sp. JEL0797]